MHPIFEVVDGRPRGWALTDRTPLKERHLTANPNVSCCYWSPAQNTVRIDCTAEWVEEDAVLREVWDVFAAPEPPGWGDLSGYGEAGIHHPRFHVLRSGRTASRSCAGNSSPPGTSPRGRGDRPDNSVPVLVYEGVGCHAGCPSNAGLSVSNRVSPVATMSV